MSNLTVIFPPLETLQLRIVTSEMQTVSQLLVELSGARGNLPALWRRQLASRDGSALRFDPRVTAFLAGHIVPPWLCYSPSIGLRYSEMTANMLDDAPALQEHLSAIFGEAPLEWRYPLHSPTDWADTLRVYLNEVRDAARRPWELAKAAIEAERHRLSKQCITLEGKAQYLCSLWPDAYFVRVQDSVRGACPALVIPGSNQDPEVTCEVQKSLDLVPTISSYPLFRYVTRQGSHPSLKRNCIDSIAYRLPYSGALVLNNADTAPSDDFLTTMLGVPRAKILIALTTPLTVGKLARRLYLSPATVNHHCNHLVSAGLIQRVRLGNEVWVMRARRGDMLIEMTN